MFLETGEGAETIAKLADEISREEDAKKLEAYSGSILGAVIDAKNADPDRLTTIFGAAFICETHAGLVRTQNAKVKTQGLSFPVSPTLIEDTLVYDATKDAWVGKPNPPSRRNYDLSRDDNPDMDYRYRKSVFLEQEYDRDLAKYNDQLQDLENACKAKTGQGQFGYRWNENAKRKKESLERFGNEIERTGIHLAVREIVRTAKLIRKLHVERRTERCLLFLIAEMHLNDLLTLAQAFMRHVCANSLNEWQIESLTNAFKTYARELQNETYCFHGVSGAYGLSIITSGADILHDLQIFLKGQLQEIRRSQMLDRIASTLEGIERDVQQAVSVLRNIEAESRRTNLQLHNIAKEIDYSNWLGNKKLQCLCALGLTVSSMRFDMTTTTRSFGLFGGGSSSTDHISGGSRIQFADALEHIKQQGMKVPRILYSMHYERI